MNRILAIVRSSIPYVKELRPIAKSIPSAILMQQLDYWFDKYPNGFYKFLAPCKHKLYEKDKSWIEELGFSEEEFQTAFKNIGVKYVSKTAFEQAGEDPFQGKFYAAFTDKIKGVTYYFRNHKLTDAVLDGMCKPTETEYLNRDCRFTETGNNGFIDLNTDTTPETTSDPELLVEEVIKNITSLPEGSRGERAGCFVEFQLTPSNNGNGNGYGIEKPKPKRKEPNLTVWQKAHYETFGILPTKKYQGEFEEACAEVGEETARERMQIYKQKKMSAINTQYLAVKIREGFEERKVLSNGKLESKYETKQDRNLRLLRENWEQELGRPITDAEWADPNFAVTIGIY